MTDAEAAQIIYDPEKVSYFDLLEFFYRTHDPTTLNQQGPDTGPQYRSAIYYHNDEQEKVAREVTRLANEKWWKGKIVTELAPAGKWWTAEEYHQEYLDKNPSGYECPSHFLRSFPRLQPEGTEQPKV
jgi:peptide-methionine (S)-S-oxide reductase